MGFFIISISQFIITLILKRITGYIMNGNISLTLVTITLKNIQENKSDFLGEYMHENIIILLHITDTSIRRQVLKLNVGKTYLVESIFFTVYKGNRTPSAAEGQMYNVRLRSKNFLGVGFVLPFTS